MSSGQRKETAEAPGLWDRLAELLSAPQGLETARLLQRVGLIRPAPEEQNQAPPAPSVNPETPAAPLREDGKRRICLIGESAAAGFFYAPWLTPAKVLARQLAAGSGEDWEVVDLAQPSLPLWQLLHRAAAALRERPELVVVFAGNNWLGLGDQPDDYPEDLDRFQDYADAVEQGGAGALRRVHDETVRARARRGISRLSAGAAAAGVPLLFVVPAANLVDFEVRQPVFWLPGDGVARWHELYRQAVAALEQGDGTATAAAAREMIELDGGDCATAHRLLASALLAQNREEEAGAALHAHLDAGCWEVRTARGSAAPSVVREEILAGCRRHGHACVDLTEVFTRHTGSPLLDRRLFLDHCHLSDEGIRVAMAAVAPVAAEILSLDAGFHAIAAPPGPGLPPPLAALSRLHAALYNAHTNRPAAGGQAPVVETLIEQSLDAAGGVLDGIRDYTAAMAAPGRAFLTAACTHNQQSPLPFQALAWLPSDLNVEALEPMARVLERRGAHGLDELDRLLVEHHAVESRRRDLAAPMYREKEPVAANTYALRRQPPSIFRAPWPTTTFFLVTGGECDLDLEVTLRLPSCSSGSEPHVEVRVNGNPAGTVEASGRWQRMNLRVPAESLRRGLNRVSLTWPLPRNAGDAAIRTAVERLRQGLPTDLSPVFGEVFSLWASRALAPFPPLPPPHTPSLGEGGRSPKQLTPQHGKNLSQQHVGEGRQAESPLPSPGGSGGRMGEGPGVRAARAAETPSLGTEST